MEDSTFKGSLFGGFNRQDVIHYIEKASRESGDLLREKDRQIQDLTRRCDDLQAQTLRLDVERTRTNAVAEELRGDLETARRAQTDSAQALSRAEEALRKKEDEMAELSQTAAALQKEVDDYHAVKNSIAEVEVGAKHRADAIISAAKHAAEELRAKAHSDSETILSKAQAEAERLRGSAEIDAGRIRQTAEDDAAAVRRALQEELDVLRKRFDLLVGAHTAAITQATSDLEDAMDAVSQMPVIFRDVDQKLRELMDNAQGTGIAP